MNKIGNCAEISKCEKCMGKINFGKLVQNVQSKPVDHVHSLSLRQ